MLKSAIFLLIPTSRSHIWKTLKSFLCVHNSTHTKKKIPRKKNPKQIFDNQSSSLFKKSYTEGTGGIRNI